MTAHLSPHHGSFLSSLTSPPSDPQTDKACGHHSTVSVGLVTCSEPGTWVATSDTPGVSGLKKLGLKKLESSWGLRGDNPEPRGPVARRGAQSPAGAEPRREHRPSAPCPKPVGFLYVPGAPARWQAEGCESVSSMFGHRRFPGRPQLQGDGPNNGVSASGSTTAPWGQPVRPAGLPCPLPLSLTLTRALIQPPLGCPRGPSSALPTITSGGSWNLPRVTGEAVG